MSVFYECCYGVTFFLLALLLSGCGGDTQSSLGNKTQKSNRSSQYPTTGGNVRINGMEKVEDAETKSALMEIEKKLSNIQRYYYVENVTSMLPQGRMEHREERSFSAPNRYAFKLVQIRHMAADIMGSETNKYTDGDTFWMRMQNAPGSAKLLLQRLDPGRRLGKKERDTMTAKHEAPNIQKCDMRRLRMAKCGYVDMLLDEKILRPFKRCDMSTLKLEQQDDATWTFLAKNNDATLADVESIRTVINKENGSLRKMEMFDLSKKTIQTVVVNDFSENPDFDEATFKYEPPEDVQVKDVTAAYIDNWKMTKRP